MEVEYEYFLIRLPKGSSVIDDGEILGEVILNDFIKINDAC